MEKNFQKNFLFASPIYKIKIDPNSYDKEKIINDIKYNKNLSGSRCDEHQTLGGGHDIHHSYQDFDNENFKNINYKKLETVYVEVFDKFFSEEIYTTDPSPDKKKKSFDYQFMIVNYSCMTEGQSMPVHAHISSDFSTIHYLNFDKKEHVPTCFYNPSCYTEFLQNLQPDLTKILSNNQENSYLWHFYHMPVEEDDMLIFPGPLKHEVFRQPPTKTKEPRIMISSNISIVGIYG